MNLAYAAALLFSTACLVLLDLRFALVVRRMPAIGAIAMIIGVAFLIVWDAVGIGLGVFRHVDSRWATGILLAPQFPLEELLFLVFLAYLTLVLLSGSRRLQQRRQRRLKEASR